MLRKYLIRNERGAALAMVAAAMVGLLACMALAIDMGILYVARGQARRAADASALAGASTFLDIDASDPASEPEAFRRAMQLALSNYMNGGPIDSAEVTVQIIRDSQKVRVWVRRAEVPTWFANFFGVLSKPVAARAAARVNNAGTAKCVKPFLFGDYWGEYTSQDLNSNKVWDFDPVQSTDCKDGNECWLYEPTGANPDTYKQYDPDVDPADLPSQTGWASAWRDASQSGDSYYYKADEYRPYHAFPGQGKSVPSSYNLWALTGPGGKDLREAFADPDCSDLHADVGDTIAIDKPGATWGNVKQGVQEWYDLDPTAKFVHSSGTGTSAGNPVEGDIDSDNDALDGLANPRVFIAGIIRPEDITSGRTDAVLVNFGLFFLDSRPGEGGPEPIMVRFLKYARGLGGPIEGTIIKVLQLVE